MLAVCANQTKQPHTHPNNARVASVQPFSTGKPPHEHFYEFRFCERVVSSHKNDDRASTSKYRWHKRQTSKLPTAKCEIGNKRTTTPRSVRTEKFKRALDLRSVKETTTMYLVCGSVLLFTMHYGTERHFSGFKIGCAMRNTFLLSTRLKENM